MTMTPSSVPTATALKPCHTDRPNIEEKKPETMTASTMLAANHKVN